MRFSFFYFGLAALFVIGCSQERDDGVIYRTLGMHTGPFNFNQPSIVSWSTASNQSSKPVIVIKTNYVVHRDVPNKPDITVIPLKYHSRHKPATRTPRNRHSRPGDQFHRSYTRRFEI
jgi:hypothetical protein